MASSGQASYKFLALDEPSAHLDFHHVEKLAEALRKIAQDKAKTGEQLIVITHDRRFVAKLNPGADMTTTFWEVVRDGKVRSSIKKRDIRFLGE
ncbi:hypothetical protein ADUPG1_010888 [Aduncisulcus paluster]|nr:hypothetical protein ADUPG1_010888 [Aduncisulcus paluster]